MKCPKCQKPLKDNGPKFPGLEFTCQCFTETFPDTPSTRKLLGLPEGDLIWRGTHD